MRIGNLALRVHTLEIKDNNLNEGLRTQSPYSTTIGIGDLALRVLILEITNYNQSLRSRPQSPYSRDPPCPH